jgi:hypothetical protein
MSQLLRYQNLCHYVKKIQEEHEVKSDFMDNALSHIKKCCLCKAFFPFKMLHFFFDSGLHHIPSYVLKINVLLSMSKTKIWIFKRTYF